MKYIADAVSKVGESAKRFLTREAVKPGWGKDELRQRVGWESSQTSNLVVWSEKRLKSD